MTSLTSNRRLIDVETTSCVYWEEVASLKFPLKNTDGRFPSEGTVHIQGY